MKQKKIVQMLLPILATLISFLPVQITLCQAAETAETVKVIKADPAQKTAPAETVKSTQSAKPLSSEDPVKNDANDSSLSTGKIIGISAGAAVLLGGVLALAGSGGGDSEPPPVPPTADHLTSAWHAEANQPGSGLTYTGTYHLLQGGGLAYDIFISNGQHLTGSGSWRIAEYKLSIHTDHGSLYSGNFAPGNITSVTLNSNTGWNLTITR